MSWGVEMIIFANTSINLSLSTIIRFSGLFMALKILECHWDMIDHSKIKKWRLQEKQAITFVNSFPLFIPTLSFVL